MKIKVLIVDDCETVRTTLGFILARRKFLIEEAENGKEALEKVAKNKPDIILLDGVMPVMDGIETCKRLKANPRTKNIPVIFCSATHRRESTEGIVEADAYIEKPFAIEKLCEKIYKVLGKELSNQ